MSRTPWNPTSRSPEPLAAENELLAQARTGDAAAVDRLIREYRPRIYAFAMSQLRQREDAEDVTQETFVRMVRMIPSYEGRGRFSTWLYEIAVNLCRDRHRRRVRERPRIALDSDVQDAAAIGSLEEHVSSEVTLAAAIARLPQSYQEVMVLQWLEQLTPTEIGEVLGRSGNLVRVQLWRARRLLVRELGDWLDRH